MFRSTRPAPSGVSALGRGRMRRFVAALALATFAAALVPMTASPASATGRTGNYNCVAAMHGWQFGYDNCAPEDSYTTHEQYGVWSSDRRTITQVYKTITWKRSSEETRITEYDYTYNSSSNSYVLTDTRRSLTIGYPMFARFR